MQRVAEGKAMRVVGQIESTQTETGCRAWKAGSCIIAAKAPDR